MKTNGLLLIPVENQVRELDPKLLLACVAARRGFASVIGSRREMEMGIDAFDYRRDQFDDEVYRRKLYYMRYRLKKIGIE